MPDRVATHLDAQVARSLASEVHRVIFFALAVVSIGLLWFGLLYWSARSDRIDLRRQLDRAQTERVDLRNQLAQVEQQVRDLGAVPVSKTTTTTTTPAGPQTVPTPVGRAATEPSAGPTSPSPTPPAPPPTTGPTTPPSPPTTVCRVHDPLTGACLVS